MKKLSRTLLASFAVAVSLGAGSSVFAQNEAPVPANWTPVKWADEDTLEFRSDCPDEGEHWSWVWLVVIDGEAYIRLGSKAASRVDCTTTKPVTAIRIAGQSFEKVELVSTPEMAEKVADAMADKYWTDIFIRYADHPYTMKLKPVSAAVEG